MKQRSHLRHVCLKYFYKVDGDEKSRMLREHILIAGNDASKTTNTS